MKISSKGVVGKIYLKETREADQYFDENDAKSSRKFWDSEIQRKKAYRRAEKYHLEFKVKRVKVILRTLLRMEDEKYDWKDDLKDVYQHDLDYIKTLNGVAANFDEDFFNLYADRMGIERRDDTKNDTSPKNFHSGLDLAEWMLYYCYSLFMRKVFLTRSQIIKLTQQQIKDLPDYSHRILTKRQLLKAHAGEPIKGFEDRRIPKPYINDVGLYKSQLLILSHFKENPWATIEIFRSAGKTYVVLALLCYMILENPRNSYAYVCEEQGKAMKRLGVIRNLMVSDRIVADYGFRIMGGSRAATEVKGLDTAKGFVSYRGSFIDGHEFVAMAPTLMAMSWTDKQAQGYHFHGIVFDDIWSISLQGQEGAMDKFLDWWGEFEGSLDQVEWFVMLRTRKGVHDLYKVLDKMGIWVKLHQKLIIKYPPKESYKIIYDKVKEVFDVKILDQALFDTAELFDDCFGKYWFVKDADHPFVSRPKQLLVWRARDPMVFEREIQNNPYLPEGKLLKWAKAKFFKLYKEGATSTDPTLNHYYEQQGAVQRIAMIDNSWGIKATADYNVILVLAKYRGHYFLEYLDVGHWGTTMERATAFQKMRKLYPGITTFIEADLQQQLIRDLKVELYRRNMTPHLKKFFSKGKGADHKVHYMGSSSSNNKLAAKKGKIHSALETPFNAGIYYFNQDLEYLEEHNDTNLRNQIVQFPKCELWDIIDCLAMATLVYVEKRAPAAKAYSNRINANIAVC